MADTDLVLKIIAQDEYKQQLEEARALVDKMSEAEREAAKATIEQQKADQALAESKQQVISALDKAGSSSQLYTNQLDLLQKQYDSGKITQDEYIEGLNNLKAGIDRASESSGGWIQSLVDVKAGLDIAGQVLDKFKQLWDFAKEGAAIQRIGQQFNQVAADFGLNGDKLVAAMDKAAHGTVDDEELMQVATRSLTQGVITSGDELVKFTEIARASAVRFGGDTAQALQSILYATEVGAQRQLKATLGVVDFTKAYDDLAVKLGKRKQDLTDEEQLQARVNAVLDKGAELVAKVGNAGEDAATKMQRFEARAANLFDEVKSGATNAILPYLDSLDFLQKSNDQNVTQLDKLNSAYSLTVDQFGENSTYAQLLKQAIDNLTKSEEGNARSQDSLDQSTRVATRSQEDAAQATEKLAAQLRDAQQAAAGYADETDRASRRSKELADANKAESESLAGTSLLAVQYTQTEQKRADITQKIAELDAQIASQGTAHQVIVNNQRMTEDQRAIAVQKLAVAQENAANVARKSGETDAEYALKVAQAKEQVNNLSAALGTHTAVVGGATKAQLANRDALEKQLNEFDRANEIQRATELFNDVADAVKKGSLSAEDGARRLQALNDVSHLYSDTALETAKSQIALIAAFTDPKSSQWVDLLSKSRDQLDGMTDSEKKAQDATAALHQAMSAKDFVAKTDLDTKPAQQSYNTLKSGIESGAPIQAKVTIEQPTTAKAVAGDTFAERAAQLDSTATKASNTISGVASGAVDDLTNQVTQSNSKLQTSGNQALSVLKSIGSGVSAAISAAVGLAGNDVQSLYTKILNVEGIHNVEFKIKVTGDKLPTIPTGGPLGGGRQAGGPVDYEGWYYLHSNEYVLSQAMRAGKQDVPDSVFTMPRIPQAPGPAAPQQAQNVKQGDTNITNNNFYDALAAKQWQERQRMERLQSVMGAM